MASARAPSELADGYGFPWIVRERAGAGSSAVVFRATHATSGEVAALKVASGALELHREAELLARIVRRWGPRLLDVGRLPSDALGCARGASFLAIEWSEGHPVEPHRVRGDREHLAAVVAHAVGRALAELHESGVRHGDVKPANVVVRDLHPAWDVPGDRGATLVDLGLSAAFADVATTGTPRYLAPEGMDGQVGCAADLFALGLTLAEILDPTLAAAPDLKGALVRWEPAARSLPAQWARALLATAPGGRPSALWVSDRAARFLNLRTDAANEARGRELSVKRSYLGLRSRELLGVEESALAPSLKGAPRAWVESTCAWTAKLGATIQEASSHEQLLGRSGPPPLGPLDARGRVRWLMSLVGTHAVAWGPALAAQDEAELAARLVAVARVRPVAAVTLDDLVLPVPGLDESRPVEPSWDSAVGAERAARLVGELSRPVPDPRALMAAEDDVTRGDAPPAVVLALATSLLRSGHEGRAFAALGMVRSDEASALRAEIARRRGDAAEAVRLARRAAKSKRQGPRAQACATLARLACDAGALDEALALLSEATGPAAAEVRGLIAWRRGSFDEGLAAVALALVQAPDDESAARLEGVRGLLLHARGDSMASAAAFARAVERATRSGSVVEEATYLTGAAAAAADSGDVGMALETSHRAALLWERLLRPRDAARAWLAAASAFAAVGATHDADVASDEAELRSAESGDLRAVLYAQFARIEARLPGDEFARALAARAVALVESAAYAERVTPAEHREDRLRATARSLVWGNGPKSSAALSELDVFSQTMSPALRLEWWGSRAAAIVAATPSEDGVAPPVMSDAAGDVVRHVLALAEVSAPLLVRGPALGAALQLAHLRNDGEGAQRLEEARARAAQTLRAHTPVAHQAGLVGVSWARLGEVGSGGLSFSGEQVARLESILRALGGRESLRTLLTQVLDALVVWTGVERGMLLLRAPDGRLVPRAARNLARRDLAGEQLALSQTLARRALETCDAVVATDAFAEADVHASVHALRLRSVLAVPLLARGEALGVVYLDDRARRGAFGPRELAWVRVLAGQAARAIVDVRDQVLLRRSARRATRAARRLEVALASRDAELDVARQELDRTRIDPEPAKTRYRYDGIVGRSEPMRAVLRLVDKITPSAVPVLLIGESGTGKELVACAIHSNGPRARRPFVSENCASVPETLLESTLFGHVRGAFTGASSTRAGLFDVADGGTLFLDEIGEMSLAMQAKMLRVLQDGEIRPVGGERSRRVDVRVIGATHRDLEQMVKRGEFRQDLYYRLNVVTLRVPPLRERQEDIAPLVAHFIEKHAGRKLKVSRAALDRLCGFSWPGNVRQLENEIRRACLLAEERIEDDVLSPELRQGPAGARPSGLDLRSRVDQLETELVREALKRTAGNQTKAAEALGLSRFGLQKMMKRLAIVP